MDVSDWWKRRGMALTSVLAMGAIAASGWLYTEHQQLEREVVALSSTVDDAEAKAQASQIELAEALGEALGPRLNAIEQDARNLEWTLFGAMGAPLGEDDVVGQLQGRIAQLDGDIAQLDGNITQLDMNMAQLHGDVQRVRQCLDDLVIMPQLVGDGFYVSC